MSSNRLETELDRAFADEIPGSKTLVLPKISPFAARRAISTGSQHSSKYATPMSPSTTPTNSPSPSISKFSTSSKTSSISPQSAGPAEIENTVYIEDALDRPPRFKRPESYPGRGSISGYLWEFLGYPSASKATSSTTREYIAAVTRSSPNISESSTAASTPNDTHRSSLFTTFKRDVGKVIDTVKKPENINIERNDFSSSDAESGRSIISWVEVVDEMKRPDVKLIDRKECDSPVMSVALAEQIRTHLPPLLREASAWQLVYSMEQHGISLHTLLTKCESFTGPCLLAIKDDLNNIFGAFANEPLSVHNGFFGTGECFLWKLEKISDENVLKAFHATMKNEYMIVSDSKCLAFGGGEGRFGLWVDDELLNGHSEKSIAFDNDILSSAPDFQVMSLELWTFKI